MLKPSDRSDEDKKNPRKSDSKKSIQLGFLVDSLAKLHEKTLLDETDLAQSLKVSSRTIRRMVSRFELPPPTKLGKRVVWMAGKVLKYIEDSLDIAENEAIKERQRIERMTE